MGEPAAKAFAIRRRRLKCQQKEPIVKKMKWIAVFAAVVLAVFMQAVPAQDNAQAPAPEAQAPAAPAAPEQAQPAPEVDMSKLGQIIGANIGRNLAAQFEADGIDVDKAALVKAFEAALNGAEPTMSDEEMQQTMRTFAMAAPAMRAKAGEKNLAAGQAFLTENATKEGVKTTESGLQYKVLQEGTGATPTANDRVQVHYRGRLINGREFDSSYKRGEPAEFPVTGVIKGWTEALQLMKEGGKMEIYVPAALAYGERPQQGIPPNSTLIFEVELLKVMPNQQEPGGVDIPTPQDVPQNQGQ
jgi:FKBP-type peptidyl-prolyl cis-trans isomerase